MTRAALAHAAELLERLVPQATPGPWRDSTVDGNRYAALVSDTCIRGCDGHAARYADLAYHHPHEGYGGCLIAESQMPQDRRLMAVLRNVADDLPALLRAVAEDPIEVGEVARRIADAVIQAHRPLPGSAADQRQNVSPASDTTRHPTMTLSGENASPPGDTLPCG